MDVMDVTPPLFRVQLHKKDLFCGGGGAVAQRQRKIEAEIDEGRRKEQI